MILNEQEALFKSQWLQQPYTKIFQQQLEKLRIELLEQCETLSISIGGQVDIDQIKQKLARAKQLKLVIDKLIEK